MNGSITGFLFYADYNPEGRRPVAENLRLIGNGVGISVGAEARIRTSTIASGGIGIICAGGCLIEQNVVSGNNGTGIEAARSTVIGNAVVSNGGYGLVSIATRTGYGNNILFGNNGGGEQVFNNGMVLQLHPNVCEPNCP
jgi:parallel beta-helix repeat protein